MYLYDSYQLWRRLVRPEALGVHFDLGLRAFDAKDKKRLVQNRVAVAMLPEGGPHSLEHMALLWREHWLEDRHEDALAVGRQIVERFPEDVDGSLELAQMLIDVGRHAEAVELLSRAVEKAPGDADLWYELGLAAERSGDEEACVRAFHEVWKLEHDEEPKHRLFLAEEMFVKAVEDTLSRLPEPVQDALGNVAVIIEDYPEEWVVAEGIADPRLLGLFVGPAHHQAGSVESVPDGPARIYLFRWNIERQCRSIEEVEHEIGVTVLHEVGHYLGLDEEQLHLRGLS